MLTGIDTFKLKIAFPHGMKSDTVVVILKDTMTLTRMLLWLIVCQLAFQDFKKLSELGSTF